MTEPLPFAMLSPLGSELTSLLQPKEKGARDVAKAETERGPLAPKGGCQEETTHDDCDEGHPQYPPPVIQKRIAPSTADEANEAPHEAKGSGGPLGTTLLEIDRIIARVEPERNSKGVTTGETLASKEKHTEEASSENKIFDLQLLGS
jgi:hypothetical protein